MKIEPKTLELLAAIVETRSFAAAAARLGTSAPAVSRDVKAIETRLGQPLFDRSVRPAVPNDLCRALAENGTMISFATRQAETRLAQYQRGDSGVVRIAGPPFFIDHVIVPMVADFQRTRPQVRFEFHPAFVAEALALLRQGQVDLALCPVELTQNDPSIVFTPIMPALNVIALRSGHPLLRRSSLSLPAVLEFPWVSPPEGSPLWQDLQSMLEDLGAHDVDIALKSVTSASIVNFLLRSDALSLLPQTVVQSLARSGITELPLTLPARQRKIGILSRTATQQTHVVRMVQRHVLSAFRRQEKGEDKHHRQGESDKAT